MPELDAYFSAGKVIGLLCKYRIKFARQRHDLHKLNDVSINPSVATRFHSLSCPDQLARLMPPRRQWIRLQPKDRKAIGDQNKIAVAELKRTIATTHMRVTNGDIQPPSWYLELQQFVTEVQQSITGRIEIRAPEIIAARKENNKYCTKFRPIASFSLKERIIISLTTRYLTRIFDPFLYNCAHAFRKPNSINPINHHTTVDRILNFLKKNTGKEIWVAECDIKKFYDCVDHRIAKRSFLEFIAKADTSGEAVDDRAKCIFEAYLDAFAFNIDVLPLNDGDYFDNQGIRRGEFEWPAKELEQAFYKEGYTTARIGIPQGGALSCLLANLVLHGADDLVLLLNEDSNLLYLRFCDDMVILSTSEQECREALDRYLEGINNLQLLAHTPQKITTYDKSFWSGKSKLPYKWGDMNRGGVPWLSFVGYQIRYDGGVRVRKKSIQKEMTKQSLKGYQLMKALQSRDELKLNEFSRKSLRQQLFAVQSRLISMSVGRVDPRNFKDRSAQTLCWANGFNRLTSNQSTDSQLRNLDRERNKTLYRVRKQLQALSAPCNNPDANDDLMQYFGHPYSYFAMLHLQRVTK